MKRFIESLMSILFACLSLATAYAWEGNDSTLFWQIEDNGNTVDDGPNDVYTFLGFEHADDELGVRVACYDRDGNFVNYLNPAYPDPLDYIDWEYNDQVIGTRDDIRMTKGSQAYYGRDDYLERLFQLQLGTYDSDYNFIPLLYTNSELVDGKYWYDWGTLAPYNGDWTPTAFYTINPVSPTPEPSSSLLLLLGASFVLLLRKRATR